MKNLILKPGKRTLGVHFDAEKGILEIKGVSYPENPWEFFQPLREWLNHYISEIGKPLTLDMDIKYLNSGSVKSLMDFLEILEAFHKKGGGVRVNWYHEEDDDMAEMSEELTEELNLTLELINISKLYKN